MFKLIQVEFMKLKRKKFIILILISAFTMPLISVLYYLGGGPIRNFSGFSIWGALSYTEWIILPFILGIVSTMILFDDRQNDTLKQIWIAPVSKSKYLFSKLLILILFSVLYMFLTAVSTIGGGVLIGFKDINNITLGFLFKKSMQIGILTPLAILPIIVLEIASKNNYIFPICATIVYVFLGFILIGFTMEYHPLSIVTAMIIHDIPTVETKEAINLRNCYINFTGLSVISFVLSVILLKKQDY